MAYSSEGGTERVWHKAGDADGCTGDWTCSNCSAKITELPFAPDKSRLNMLRCKDCYRTMRQSFRR
ncbi:MAG: hypothetical protein A3A43_00160 [Candidatus Liptonbacteria bacterium RIFCSPLOWO2_01_FULL_56_20]|uniref:Uncharacterized protein n=1 Tax=Candidatus Liptonbacteria bacterium RIFCSPLOWO2_01_FULL_56_20 TaxID=1798652 RepID=A0A1G2CIK9_9BACT|nr:MAG: hypothetical protein A2681_01580 [Candidatus Liptonbacteria bacterium RIFCSPHIGHO2_01_FULL_56_18b]OGZ01264.1 MAG: hypothetical protein A3A43_00160 [Candidatus Liptonbacteria bacterium RIFCSPLOWO2_01_FULL_56_20]